MSLKYFKINKEYLLLFLVVLVCYGYFFHQTPDANENSRLNPVYAVVNDGTLQIDKYHQNTIDKAYYDGHYYSDKAPGSSLLAIPIYAFFKFLDALFSLHLTEPTARYLLRVVVVSLPSALLAVFIYQFLGYFNKNDYYRLVLTVSYSLGTIAFTYSTLFYGHQITAVILFSCFYLLFTMKRERKEDNKHIMLSGFLAGYACITEYPATIIAFLIFIYLLVVLEKKSKIWLFLLGGLVPILMMGIYNHLCFGNVLKIGMFYEAAQGFRTEHSKGFVGLTYPKPGALFLLYFSVTRGLFFLSPFLLLAVPGFYYLFRKKEYRNECYLFFAINICYSLFYSAFWSPGGGWAFGPRYLVPMLPFLIVPIIFCFDNLENLSKRTLTSLGILSIVLVSIGTVTKPCVPEGIENTLGAFSLPLLIKGYTAQNGGIPLGLHGPYSLIPLLIFLTVAGVVLTKIIKKTKINTRAKFTREVNKKSKLIENSLLVFLILLILSLIAVKKESAYVYNIMGLEYIKKNQLTEAFNQFNKAVKINPKFAQAYYNLAIMFVNNKEYNKAIQQYQKTLEIDPDHAGTHYNLGVLYKEQKEYNKAIQEFKKALETDPDHAGTHYNLGVLYKEQKEYNKAIQEFKKSLETNPEHAEAHHNLGVLYYEGKEYTKAIQEFQKTLEIDPDYAKAHHNLGVLYGEQKEYTKAIQEFKKALETDPDYAKAHYNLGNLYYYQKEYRKALQEFEYLLKLNPYDENAKTKIKILKGSIK